MLIFVYKGQTMCLRKGGYVVKKCPRHVKVISESTLKRTFFLMYLQYIFSTLTLFSKTFLMTDLKVKNRQIKKKYFSRTDF